MSYDPEKYTSDDLDELLWIGFDFDDTLAEKVWPLPGIGEPIEKGVSEVRRVFEAGFKPVIFTARPWADYRPIERWCRDHNVPVRRIICGKPLMLMYMGDEAHNIKSEDWLDELSA